MLEGQENYAQDVVTCSPFDGAALAYERLPHCASANHCTIVTGVTSGGGGVWRRSLARRVPCPLNDVAPLLYPHRLFLP